MPFNGLGVYAAPASTWNPAVSGTEIDENDWAALLADIEDALTNAICKDGQSVTSAVVPFAAGVTINNTGLSVYDTDASHKLAIVPGSNLTGNKTLTIVTGDSSRTVTLTGNPTLVTGAALTPGGRLTLTTAVPYLSASVTAATTVYYTPAVHNIVPIYDGTSMIPTVFAEVSQALSDSTKSPAGATTSSNYDMFVWSDSGTVRCTRGPVWSSATARGTGAGTTELTIVQGVLVNANAITNGPAAQRGTYVGTIRTNGSTQIDMILGGSGASGGESCNIGLCNYYNSVPITCNNLDSATSWTGASGTYRAKNNNAANGIAIIVPAAEWEIAAVNNAVLENNGANTMRIAIGLDSTTTAHAAAQAAVLDTTAGKKVTLVSSLRVRPAVGYHVLYPLEINGGGTDTWYGSATGVLFSATMRY